MRVWCAVLLALCFVAVAADAQPGRWSLKPSPQLGLRGGYDYDIDVWSAGGQARWPFGRRGSYQLVPSGDVFFAAGAADWQGNADVIFSPGPRGGFYFGFGLGYSSRAVDGAQVFNRLVGLNLARRLYMEGRWTNIAGKNIFRLAVGYNLSFGKKRDEAESIFDARSPLAPTGGN